MGAGILLRGAPRARGGGLGRVVVAWRGSRRGGHVTANRAPAGVFCGPPIQQLYTKSRSRLLSALPQGVGCVGKLQLHWARIRREPSQTVPSESTVDGVVIFMF
jgi:hypothetical protein